jgi:hypothetical protein
MIFFLLPIAPLHVFVEMKEILSSLQGAFTLRCDTADKDLHSIGIRWR